MRDFTLKTYESLIVNLKEAGNSFKTFKDYINSNSDKRLVVLRHDVDAQAKNSLLCAKILNYHNIAGSFYFRIVKQSFNAKIIREIYDLGHEIGYHYEDLTIAKGDTEKAIHLFEKNLAKFRNITPIYTLCMHGSPLSKWDNRDVWKHINYKDYGLIGEPYFDIDFNKVLYLTDTGRTWNSSSFSVRDKVNSSFNFSFKSTYDIIKNNNKLPEKIMINFHPQRWNDNMIQWSKELVFQNLKNVIKKYFYVKN